MKIRGANLADMDVEFSNLSEFGWTEDNNIAKTIKYIENLYYDACFKKDDKVRPIQINEDGKVVITKGMVNHRCEYDMDILRTISQKGILASEWFGVLESEREGCFCAFVSRMKGKDYRFRGSLAEDDYSRLYTGNNIILFIDDKHPVWKSLERLDYFEFERIKRDNPELLDQYYSKEEQDMLGNFIGELSFSGKDMHNGKGLKTDYWSAIPGGIPSFLINGLCTKRNILSKEEIDELAELFPNAIIFNGDLDIIYNPNSDLQKNYMKM